ncbi:MAG: peptidoglycan-binding protein [Clostridiales bacterium]|jgi:spore germination cell wall hydrolase CwlJ-like protein|nr:peptidoglycan-binding protein [Clostridiales bacterium]
MFKRFLKDGKAKIALFTMIISLLVPYTAQAAAYTVAQGDSLYSIGKRFNTTSSAIMSSNNLSSSTIYPGQVLNIPGNTYTVKAGDTLYLIAKSQGVTLTALRQANNKWNDVIYPGQVLVIPNSGTIQASPSNSTTGSKSVISYTAAELDLLARLIMAEAENQPYAAKVAVGAVVINRVQSDQFPNTISGVINQVINGYYQFSPVLNGYINRLASEDAKRAAIEALQGNDPTNGALFYFDDSATNKWLWSKPLAIKIGNMVYVY